MPPLVNVYKELEVFHDKSLDGLEFCRLAYLFFDNVISQPDGSHKLRERRGAIKPLIEELLPICRYIQTFYGVGNYISIRWINGNQSYDAKMETRGNMVEMSDWPSSGTLEVTRAVHKNEHLMRELLNAKGGGFGLDGIKAGKGKRGFREIESAATVYTNQSYIADMAAIILNSITAKILKLENGDYPENTTLIVDCALNTIFLKDEWDRLITLIREKVPANTFSRIFLTADSGYKSVTL